MAIFRVLGPLEVSDSNGTVPLTSQRQRALLARLLMESGQVVTVDTLIDCAWSEDDRPLSPKPALQTQMSRLRSALGMLGEAVVTVPPGYRIELSEVEFDAEIFEMLLREGHESQLGDPQAALDIYEKALALWQGTAYGEFADSFAHAESSRLAQLKLNALEDRIELLLTVNDFTTAINEAKPLIRGEIFRESLWGRLMRGLALAGRSPEALQVYHDLREKLKEELGVEPSAEIRSLHLKILHEELPKPTGPVGPEYSGTHFRRTPAGLDSFISRKKELAMLGSAFADARLVTLLGPGGVGKSRLAIEYASKMESRSTCAWVELSSLHDSKNTVIAFLDALNLPLPPDEEPLDSLVIALQRRDVLIMVDNCEHVVDQVATIISALITHCPKVRVLATSRERLALKGEGILKLGPLSVYNVRDDSEIAPALQLFIDRLASAGYTLRPDDSTAMQLAAEVCRRLDGLPLALELTAGHVSSLGLEAVATATDLLGLASGSRQSDQRHHASLRAALSWSYELLSPAEQRLLRRLSVFPGPFSTDWAAAVCRDEDSPLHTVLLLLSSLVDKSLVSTRLHATSDGPTHALLETVKEFAREKIGESEKFETSLRHARTVVEWVEQTASKIGTSDDGELALIAARIGDLRAARTWTHQNDPSLALRLSAALYWYAGLRADFEIIRWSEEAANLSGVDEHPARPAVLGSAAWSAMSRGDANAAAGFIEEARLSSSQARTLPESAILLNVSGALHTYLGEPEKGLNDQHRAWKAARAAGDRVAEVASAGYLALGLSQSGDREGSDEWLNKCFTTARQTPGPSIQALIEGLAGECEMETDPDAAFGHFTRAYELASSVDAHGLIGLALTSKVTLQARISDSRDSVSAYLPVLKHWRDTGNQIHLWITLRNLIPVLSRYGQYAATLGVHAAVASSPAGLRMEFPEDESLQSAASKARRQLGEDSVLVEQKWKGASINLTVALAEDAIKSILKTGGNTSEDSP
ncbi:BTAD domain-containing putative transcriptional regulator [Streptomyces sp. NPDC099088]|uniref:BTAD domain-containing putative transcriptional regulator n=1 Tax=Streptomyces sp. NPDC099088 TaxID=3366101 RepID=UPI0037FB068B